MKRRHDLFREAILKFLEKKEIVSYQPTACALEALGYQVRAHLDAYSPVGTY